MSARAPVDDPAREAAPPPVMQWRKAFFFLLRMGLSVGLLWFVAQRVSFEDLGRRLGAAKPAWLALAVALLIAVTVASALRWQRVASVVCPGVRWAPVWRVLMISTFFDQLIFNMSGDAFRVWFMNRMAPSITH